jgi:competence protein ComFA
LTDEQKYGSDFLFDCYKNRKNGYLQAVCGAGKTEITLDLIDRALQDKKVIAFVIPRVEIIKQVSKRFASYFRGLNISSVYEGVKLKLDSPFIITTPQQLINFYHEFDILIIDEVDAFPLLNNSFLWGLIDKALKPDGIKISMSATIPDDFLRAKDLPIHLISRRYHQRDLPEPTLMKANSYLDTKVTALIKEYFMEKKPLIVYLSSINKVIKLKDVLASQGIESEVISSKTSYKKEVIKNFENQEITILLSTTILERGVTFKDLSVLVIEADNPVFNKASLIQIAGRVKRITDIGEVIFMAKFKTKAMLDAIKEIKELNQKNDL